MEGGWIVFFFPFTFLLSLSSSLWRKYKCNWIIKFDEGKVENAFSHFTPRVRVTRSTQSASIVDLTVQNEVIAILFKVNDIFFCFMHFRKVAGLVSNCGRDILSVNCRLNFSQNNAMCRFEWCGKSIVNASDWPVRS